MTHPVGRLLRITRPLMGVLALVPFAAVAVQRGYDLEVLAGGVALGLVVALSFLFNDLCDYRVDRLAGRRDKLLVQGAVKAWQVMAAAVSLALAGALLMGGRNLVPYAGLVLVACVYSPLSLRVPFLKNIWATLVFLTAIWWFQLITGVAVPMFVAVSLAVYFLARELDIDRYEIAGDAVSKGRTLAVELGYEASGMVVFGLFAGAYLLAVASIASMPAQGLMSVGFVVSVSSLRTVRHYPTRSSRLAFLLFLGGVVWGAA